MTIISKEITTQGMSRVFFMENSARPETKPVLQMCSIAGSVTDGRGDVTNIYCNDPSVAGRKVIVGRSRDAPERIEFDVMSKLSAKKPSYLHKLARQGCPVDTAIAIGKCNDLAVYDLADIHKIVTGAIITNYEVSELGNFDGDEEIIETATVSGDELIDVAKQIVQDVAADAVTNEVLDIVICSTIGCGWDCAETDDGCQKIYAVTKSTGGSPGTSPDIVYSLDGGGSWYNTDIETIATGNDADAVSCLGIHLVALSEDQNSLHWITKSLLVENPPATNIGFTEVTTGFVAGNNPIDAFSTGTYMFICAQNGYIYGTANPVTGVEVLENGSATNEDLNAIHAVSDNFAVAVGDNGAIIKTENQKIWSVTGPDGVSDNFTSVWLINKYRWFVGSDAGDLYYTPDGGSTWDTINLPDGSSITSVNDISFTNHLVGYIGVTVGSAGKIYRTKNGGFSFVTMAEDVGIIPTNAAINTVWACEEDANFMVAGGLISGGDGIIMVASVESA